MSQTILYIGGFELPDHNAAAQRVIGIAKGLKAIGYRVVFINSLKKYDNDRINEIDYFGFKCFEYKRETEYDYLISGKTILRMIKMIMPDSIIAYNYPSVSLNKIRKYCNRNHIRCYADATEWYHAFEKNIIYRIIKNLDTAYRMRVVQKKMDGVIAISRFLYNYYKNSVNSVLIPPTVDMTEDKWENETSNDTNSDAISYVYAGFPSSLKEKLDTIVQSISEIAKERKVILNILGITKEQFIKMYKWNAPISESIFFWGHVEHQKVIKLIQKSDWAIILRENNRVVNAGFPTKVVEAISCGTPIVANEFSNIFDYLDEHKYEICDCCQIIYRKWKKRKK